MPSSEEYTKGKIYKLTYEGCEEPYYGSTCGVLKTKLTYHKNQLKSYLKGEISCKCMSFEILEKESCEIELVEYYPCKSNT